MALPDDHLTNFNHLFNAKTIWAAIKKRFRGNEESKKMQLYILKEQFATFNISNFQGMHKGYEIFHKLFGQLTNNGVRYTKKEVNFKFLRSLHAAWKQVIISFKTKGVLNTIEFDDFYNSL